MVSDANNDENRFRSGDSGTATTLMSVDDARAQAEKAFQGSGLSNIAVQRDKDGNSHVLGFKVPRELLPAVETVLPNAILWLQRAGSQFSYDKALWGANKLKIRDQKAETIAKAAEYGVRWGLIGIKPITDAIFNVKTYSKERHKMFKEFKPVIEATGVNYKTNEVIRNSFDELHDDMVTNMKMLSSDLLTLAPIIYVGLKDQRAAAKDATRGTDSQKLKAELENIKKENQRMVEREQAIKKAREEFIQSETGKHVGLDGKKLTDKELGEWFDRGQEKRDRIHEQQQYNRVSRDHDDDRMTRGEVTGEQLAVLGLSLGSQIIKTNIRESSDRRNKGITAWKMIQHLKEEVESQTDSRAGDGYGERSADDVYISTRNGRMNLRDYVIEIFQQHERDRLRTSGKITAAERQGMNPLGPVLVEQLMPTADIIAESIADGRLNPYALVNLVGDNKVVVHKANGARTFAREGEVKKMVDDLMAVMGTHEQIKPEEFFANFADPALIGTTLRNNLQHMHGQEKTFFVALFPDAILEQAGMKKKEIVAHRREAHRYLHDVMTASVLTIAEMDKETLKQVGLSDKEIDAVHTVAERIQDGDRDAIKTAVNGRDKTVLAAVRTVGLNEQVHNIGDGGNFWTRMIEKARNVQSLVSESKKRPDPAMHEANSSHAQEAYASGEGKSFSDQVQPRVREGFSEGEQDKAFVRRTSREDLPSSPRSV